MKPIVIVSLLIVAIILGTIVAVMFSSREAKAPTTTPQARILTMKLGKASVNKQGQQLFAEQYKFTNIEDIALKINAENVPDNSISLPVRLLDSKGNIAPLSPGTVSTTNGDSRFCCWKIPTAGKYSLQVFRPEGGITTLPVTIEKDFSDTLQKK